MKTNTYDHLENLAAAKGIVCERRGRKIELTIPSGAVTAECDSVAEALDTMRGDPTFSDLPIKIHTLTPATPWAPVTALEALRDLMKALPMPRFNIRNDFSVINAHAQAQRVIHEADVAGK